MVNGCDLESGWLEMGRILAVLNTRLKHEKYKEILTEVAISDRTAAYLVAIVVRLDSQQIKIPQGISWRKMAEMAPAITYDNQVIIFEKIRQHTREELIELRRKGIILNQPKRADL